jgi:hypothetical protein
MNRWLLSVRVAVLLAWTLQTTAATAQEILSMPGTAKPAPVQNYQTVAPPSQVAQPSYVPQTSYVPQSGYVQQPGYVQEAAPCSSCQGQSEAVESTGSGHPFLDALMHPCQACKEAWVKCLNNKGLGCCATHNSFGCTSTYAQYTFIFGSCRQFFNEPCVPPPAGKPCGAVCGCGN